MYMPIRHSTRYYAIHNPYVYMDNSNDIKYANCTSICLRMYIKCCTVVRYRMQTGVRLWLFCRDRTQSICDWTCRVRRRLVFLYRRLLAATTSGLRQAGDRRGHRPTKCRRCWAGPSCRRRCCCCHRTARSLWSDSGSLTRPLGANCWPLVVSFSCQSVFKYTFTHSIRNNSF